VAWSADGKVASGSVDKTITIWNTNTGQCVSTLTVDLGVRSVAFSPDGSKISAVYLKIQIFDAKTKAKLGSALNVDSHLPVFAFQILRVLSLLPLPIFVTSGYHRPDSVIPMR